MRILRLAIGALGVAAGLFGAWSLREVDWADWPSLLSYLVGGVLVHDFVLAPVVVGLGVLSAWRAPAAWRAPMVVALVVWGGVTVMAVPVLGRFGALPDNPTLLDRPYLATWAVGTVLVLVAAGSRRRRCAPGVSPPRSNTCSPSLSTDASNRASLGPSSTAAPRRADSVGGGS